MADASGAAPFPNDASGAENDIGAMIGRLLSEPEMLDPEKIKSPPPVAPVEGRLRMDPEDAFRGANARSLGAVESCRGEIDAAHRNAKSDVERLRVKLKATPTHIIVDDDPANPTPPFPWLRVGAACALWVALVGVGAYFVVSYLYAQRVELRFLGVDLGTVISAFSIGLIGGVAAIALSASLRELTTRRRIMLALVAIGLPLFVISFIELIGGKGESAAAPDYFQLAGATTAAATPAFSIGSPEFWLGCRLCSELMLLIALELGIGLMLHDRKPRIPNPERAEIARQVNASERYAADLLDLKGRINAWEIAYRGKLAAYLEACQSTRRP